MPSTKYSKARKSPHARKILGNGPRVTFPERVWEKTSDGRWCSRVATKQDLAEREKVVEELGRPVDYDRAYAAKDLKDPLPMKAAA
jgi:hypothetical protein